MPLFDISKTKAMRVEAHNFAVEKELQKLVENNLEVLFNCKFVATEFSTGSVHAGRIDTLALSEENNPVIIEYKKVESSELVNQSLFYLHWIRDHKGDFQVAVNKALKATEDIEIDWSDIRVICIEPNYKKYDLHAVEVMGANIELWQYRLYKNSSLHLERVFLDSAVQKPGASSKAQKQGSSSSENEIVYSWDYHAESKPERIQELATLAREFILSIDDSIEEAFKKHYIAYKSSQNIVCLHMQKQRIILYLKLDPETITDPVANFLNAKNKGHFGTGDTQFNVSTPEEFDLVKPYIEEACNKFIG